MYDIVNSPLQSIGSKIFFCTTYIYIGFSFFVFLNGIVFAPWKIFGKRSTIARGIIESYFIIYMSFKTILVPPILFIAINFDKESFLYNFWGNSSSYEKSAIIFAFCIFYARFFTVVVARIERTYGELKEEQQNFKLARLRNNRD